MKSKIMGIFVCMLLIITAVIPITGNVLGRKISKTTYDRGTLYVGGSEPGNYSSIMDAIDDANDYTDPIEHFENVNSLPMMP